MGALQGQRVVVIGGSSGIGLAVAQAAIAEGAETIITGRSAQRLQDAVGVLGDAVRTAAIDSTDEDATREFFAELTSVDHIFVSAGVGGPAGLLDHPVESMRPAMDTRLWGSVYAAKYAAPLIAAGGSITFCSGTSSMRPRQGGNAVAAASGAAIESLARALAVELAPIRVNAVVPGLIETPMTAGESGERRDAMIEQGRLLPVGRIGSPTDIAHAALFLMQNGFVTGISLVVDGGRLVQ